MANSYTDLSKYYGDFEFLKEMKSLLIEEVLRMKAENADPTFWNSQVKTGFFTETEDGRDVRVVLPSGVDAISELLRHPIPAGCEGIGEFEKQGGDTIPTSKEISFVGFMGTKLKASEAHAGAEDKVNAIDDVLIGELAGIDGMLAYVTGERVKGGDRGNLVLFRNWGVVQDLFKSSNHGVAVRFVCLFVSLLNV